MSEDSANEVCVQTREGSRISVMHGLEAAGLEFVPLSNPKSPSQIFGIDVRSLPTQIIDMIKAAPLEGRRDIVGKVALDQAIYRCTALAFSPKSELQWTLPDVSNSGNFVAIAARELIVNVPNRLEDLAIFSVRSKFSPAELNGSIGPAGNIGPSSGADDGTNGGRGGDGLPGGAGRTYEFPNVFILFNKITLNFATPNISTAIRIEGIGVVGGDGGMGGKGGTGGYGMRGTPGERNCNWGVCYCEAGPGNGGNGGQGGSGGKGGQAGRGGAGATIAFVGPAGEHPSLSHFALLLSGGAPGKPGKPGLPGGGGQEGGGGSKPFECANGGGSGVHGPGANPPDLGAGQANQPGFDGTTFVTARDNSDLFV